MAWDERHALGVAAMDVTHREFVAHLEALTAADDARFPGLFEALAEHTRQHFDSEAVLMKQCRFPATGEHTSEHLRVLGEMAFMGRAAKAGRLKTARSYVEALPAWFATHLATMDAALAACLKRLP